MQTYLRAVKHGKYATDKYLRHWLLDLLGLWAPFDHLVLKNVCKLSGFLGAGARAQVAAGAGQKPECDICVDYDMNEYPWSLIVPVKL